MVFLSVIYMFGLVKQQDVCRGCAQRIVRRNSLRPELLRYPPPQVGRIRGLGGIAEADDVLKWLLYHAEEPDRVAVLLAARAEIVCPDAHMGYAAADGLCGGEPDAPVEGLDLVLAGFFAREKFLQPVMIAPATVPGSANSSFVGLSVCMRPFPISAIVPQRS